MSSVDALAHTCTRVFAARLARRFGALAIGGGGLRRKLYRSHSWQVTKITENSGLTAVYTEGRMEVYASILIRENSIPKAR